MASVPRVLRFVRSPAHADDVRAAVPGGAELPGHGGGAGDADVCGKAGADVSAQSDGVAGGVGAVRA